MKPIYLKYFLSFVFVGVMAMIVCIPFYIVYLAQQPATPEQLTEILQEISLCSRSISGDT